MITDLIKSINDRLKSFSDIPIISQDIDKNNVYPCFKVKIIDFYTELKSQTMIEYKSSVSVNYYPKTDLDNRIEFLKIQNMLATIFMIGVGKWYINQLEVIDHETFISCNVDYIRVDVYDEPISVSKLNEEIKIVEKYTDYIEEIILKEENIDGNKSSNTAD